MIINSYSHFGGKHGESAALKNLLAHAEVANPHTGKPFTEAMCFGIAGGIGAGYSFCPSVIKWDSGSGVSIIGRHKIYSTEGAWYRGFFDRLSVKTHITETAAAGKAYKNLAAELEAGRPSVVWCSAHLLPFLGHPITSCGQWMHTFIVYGIDETKGEAYGADRAATRVTLTLDQLAKARAGICSHKNRTLTIEPPAKLTEVTLKKAVQAGIRATTQELLHGRMRTFSLPGLEILAKMITNHANKDGWLKVFTKGGLLYCALRDLFESIETGGTGGGSYRSLYADFLDEAATVTKNQSLAELACEYRQLGRAWTELADATLPDSIKPFKQTKALLRKKAQLFEQQGEKAAKQIAEATQQLRKTESDTRAHFPQNDKEASDLLEGLRQRIVALHEDECRAAQKLQKV